MGSSASAPAKSWANMTDTYVSLVPLAEGSRINLDDSTLDKGVGPNKLVVGRIIDLEKTEQ